MTKLEKKQFIPDINKQLDDTSAIIEHLRSGTKITMSQQNKLDIFDFVDNQIRENQPKKEIVRKLKFKFNRSRAQAYRDIESTKEIFGSVRKIEKSYYKTFLIDSILDTIRMAKEAHDLKAKNAAEANLIKVLGIDKEDPNIIAPEMLQQNILMIDCDPEILGIKKMKDVESVVKKYMKKQKQNTIDITDLQNDEL